MVEKMEVCTRTKKKNKALLHAEELCSMVEKMEVCTRKKKQKKQGPAARRRIVLHGEQMEVCTRVKRALFRSKRDLLTLVPQPVLT
jgi:hypothetical protein